MRNEFAKCEIKTSEFSGRKPRAGNYWVLLPSERTDVYLLRPLSGATDEVVAVHVGMSNLISGSLPEERVRSATFPPPTTDDLADAASATSCGRPRA